MTNIYPLTPREPASAAPERRHNATVVPLRIEVYTVAEVAHMLQLSLGGAYQLCRNEQMPAKKLGNRWVVPKKAFHKWLDDLPEATDEDIENDRRLWESGRHPEAN